MHFCFFNQKHRQKNIRMQMSLPSVIIYDGQINADTYIDRLKMYENHWPISIQTRIRKKH